MRPRHKKAVGMIVYRAAIALATGLFWAFPAHAQTAPSPYPGRAAELAAEEQAYGDCMAKIYEPEEVEACAHWMALSACAMMYASRKETAQKYIGAPNYAQCRDAALEQFPPYCDDMAWINLALEALGEDDRFDAARRNGLWSKILAKTERLAPEQRLIVAREWLSSPEDGALLTSKEWRRFAVRAREDAKSLFPDISPDAVKFLTDALAIETQQKTASSEEHVVDDCAKAILLIDALDKQQFETARELIAAIDAEKLPQTYRAATSSKLAPLAQAIFGKIRLADAMCFGEFESGGRDARIDPRAEALLDVLLGDMSENRISIVRYEAKLRFPRCDFAPVLTHFAQSWNAYPTHALTIQFADELMQYIETGDPNIAIEAASVFSSQLQGAARRAFADRFGSRLTKRITALAESIYIYIKMPPSPDSASKRGEYMHIYIKALQQTYELARTSDKPRIALLLGRLYMMSGDGARARQYWSEIIDAQDGAAPDARIAAQAYELSIRSYRRDKKTAEADALAERFERVYPSHAR